MRVAVTGSHGLIGSALVAQLRRQGDDVVPVVRGAAQSDEIAWDPDSGSINAASLEGIDAVVHLAGAGVGDHRWSDAYKQTILKSRTDGTRTLAVALAHMDRPPKVLLSASAVGFYGVRGDEDLTEDSVGGTGFLADVCRQWEGATAPAADAGIRVVTMRNGVVLSAAGGALKKQLLPFRLGLGARLGSGHQQFSWITRRDVVGAMTFLIGRSDIAGPVNLTAPNPVTNRIFTQALAHAVRRPAVLSVPTAVLRLAVGREMAGEFLLASQRVLPQRLLDAGFSFADPELAGALRVSLDDRSQHPTFS
jgi:uncharacterized protein (TIGR01777 family)